MTLFRAEGRQPLCATCVYDADDSCTFPKRPDAMDCTLYCDRTQIQSIQPTYSRTFVLKTWFRRNLSWILLLSLLLTSLAIALLR
jgi:hypothetical protein